MTTNIRTARIAISAAIALVMVGGAYVLSSPSFLFGGLRVANAQSSAELLKAYAAKDTDSDGLPDWEEALYGTDPTNAHSFRADITDGEAVAQGLLTPKAPSAVAATTTPIEDIPGAAVATDTLTDQFSRTLVSQYLSTRGSTEPTPDQITTFVQTGVQNLLNSQNFPDLYTSASVKQQGSGLAALQAYVVAADAVFSREHGGTTKSELAYFNDAMTKNDATALKKITIISQTYALAGKALIALPVPSEAAYAHLEIANALIHMSQVTADMSAMNTDPLRALVGLAAYQKSADALTAGLKDMAGVYKAETLVLTQSDPGYSFYSICTYAAAP